MAGGVALEGRLEGCSVRVEACSDRGLCATLEGRGYLAGGVLDPLEAFYQAVRGKLVLAGGASGWKAGLSIVESCRLPLKLFIVYLDLRRKGRLPRRGIRPGTLEFREGERVYEVLILEEGEVTTYGALAEWSRSAVADGRHPVIAIVDHAGSVTYYEARVSRSLA